MPTRKLIIDGKEIEADDSITLLQACELAGAEIPRFCYHERLSIAGNCRMCLVEWVGAPKPQASCALQVRDIFPNKDGTPATSAEKRMQRVHWMHRFIEVLMTGPIYLSSTARLFSSNRVKLRP